MLQHSGERSPVIHVFWFNGQPVNVRRRGGGTFDEAAAAFVETMLPQNATALQGGNHAIAEDTDRRLPAVGAGQYDVLRDMQSGEGAKP
jgi:hypothetical protein